MSQQPSGLQTGGPDIPHHEDPGEACTGAAKTLHWSTTVRLPAPPGSWGRHHLPAEQSLHSSGQAGEHCESHVVWLLQCFLATGWEDGCDAGWGPHRVLDCWLPDVQTTVRTPTELCVWQGGQQHWGPTGDCLLSLPLHPIHLWLQLLHWFLPPSLMIQQ